MMHLKMLTASLHKNYGSDRRNPTKAYLYDKQATTLVSWNPSTVLQWSENYCCPKLGNSLSDCRVPVRNMDKIAMVLKSI